MLTVHAIVVVLMLYPLPKIRRESSDAKRIKQAHRKILIANHPDKGGSPYMASKVNEVNICFCFSLYLR